MSVLKKIYRYTYKRLFKKYDVLLELESAGYKNLLDVGCGSYSPVQSFNKKIHTVGVDTFEPSIIESKQKGIHNEYVLSNVLDIDKHFQPKSFDVVIACDLIEHLKKEDGYKLMEKMEQIAKHKVIIFTPNGFLEQGDRFKNPWQIHLSGWEASEFESRGYKVQGINGTKSLRGQYAKAKNQPEVLWNFISDLSELFVYNKPTKAFQLFAVKDMSINNR